MHKIYENDDLMMYVQKRYCHCCGNELQIKQTERIVRKGDPDHKAYCSIGTSYKPHGDILVIGKEYYCPLCNKSFSCDEQGRVIEAQTQFSRKVVTREEIDDVEIDNLLTAQQNILKYRWFLLIPFLGTWICTFILSSGKLSKKLHGNDITKILLSSIMILMLGLIITRVLYPGISELSDIHKYIFMIPSFLAFNIPTLLYVNRKFKY